MESSATPESGSRRLRSDTRPLPRSADELVALFKRVIELPGIQKIEISQTQFVVARMVGDGELVVPDPGEQVEVDAGFVLQRITEQDGLVELAFDPTRHPYLSLLEATAMVNGQRLRPTHLIAPEGEWLAAFLGLPEDATPESCFGMKVLYTKSESFENKILVLGGPTNLLTDVSYGVAIDMGG